MTKGEKTRLCRFIPKDKKKAAELLLSVILSIVLLVTAICFIVNCVSLYKNGGDTPFSRESVALHLKKVAPISFISIGLAIAVGILSIFTKEPKTKNIPIKKRTLLLLLKNKLSDFATSEEYTKLAETERKRRKTVILISFLLSALFTAAALIFVLNPARYSVEEVNTDIAYSVVIAAISTALIFATVFVASRFLETSYAAEIEGTKAELKRLRLSGKETDSFLASLSKNEGHTVLLVRVIIFAVAVTFIILGIFNGGMADVLGKAVRICTECIGLG